MQSNDVERIAGGMPALVRCMLYTFFDPGPDAFSFNVTGMMIHTEEGLKHINGEFGFQVVDERASKTNLDVKGAAGTKCCLRCLNVVGARTEPGDCDFLVHYATCK